ncbi:MAG: type II toxin-antitoxin system Phd/YefM family antitoxin [Patescibacteria group bacterium]
MKTKMKVVGLKELRERTEDYIDQIKQGHSFVVLRRSEPVFTISPPEENEELWETVIDFTKIKKGGIKISELLARL